MKHIIVGSGPCGLSLAYILALNNKKVILIEQDNKLGGSWKSEWHEDKYWSENSPRVLFNIGNTYKLLNNLGFKKEDFENIYGNLFETNYKFVMFFSKYFNILDYIIFILSLIKYNIIEKNITVNDWMNSNKLSVNGKKAIKILCILVCDKPENTNITDFFKSFGLYVPKQMKEPNEWHRRIESYLKKKKNVKILKNTKVIKLIEDKRNNISDVYIRNINNNLENLVKCDKVFLCTQSNNIYPILEKSSLNIRNNWMTEEKMKIWSENTYYIGFGFQLHFDVKVDFKNEWCWSCKDDWTVIILPVSNWLKEFSKDKEIKTVWSCCIVDMDSKSKNINKTANECNLEEVLDECIYQIKKGYNIPKPYKITISNGIKKENNKWLSKKTGYTKNIYDDLEMKGNINNLYALGSFTKDNKSGVANMGSSIDATVNYLKKYMKDIKVNIF